MAAKSSLGRQDCGVGAAGGAGSAGGGGGGGTDTSRVSSVSSQFSDAPQPSPSSHSSTPSWCEEPAQSNMDISTGHMILVNPHAHIYRHTKMFISFPFGLHFSTLKALQLFCPHIVMYVCSYKECFV